MARRRSEQFKAIAVTAALLLLWALLPTAIKMTARASFEAFHAPAWEMTSTVKDLQEYWGQYGHSKYELIEAGIDLSRRNAAYQLVKQRSETLHREIRSLERILDLPPLPRHRFEVARVSRRSLNAWWQQITIRKGHDYAIPEGAAVIFGDGVVGRVSEVREHSSLVELVSSRSFRMAANFEGDSRPVTYQGALNTALGPAYGHVRDVPADIQASAAAPLRLVSSPLGGVFPGGLKIGEVGELEPDANGLFQEGKVLLDERLLDLREVAVLIPVDLQNSTAVEESNAF